MATVYNTDFVVKYHDIKEELLEKNRLKIEEYTEDELNLVIDELYRHELLSVFFCEDICDEKIVDAMNYIWKEIKTYRPFQEIFALFKERKFPGEKTHDEVVFTAFFCYDIFFMFHQCICEFLSKRDISSDILEQMKKLIEEM